MFESPLFITLLVATPTFIILVGILYFGGKNKKSKFTSSDPIIQQKIYINLLTFFGLILITLAILPVIVKSLPELAKIFGFSKVIVLSGIPFSLKIGYFLLGLAALFTAIILRIKLTKKI